MWYGFARYLIAAGCLFAVVAWRRELIVPPRTDWKLIIVASVFQLVIFSALVGIALTVLPPGRASVLAYSTPLWVMPLAAWRLGERISIAGLIGVVLGVTGICVIAAPAAHSIHRDQLIAYALLAGAAVAWAISIVFIRGHRFTASTLALAPWQMLIATVLLLLAAMVFERRPTHVSNESLLSLVYVAPIASAYAYWSVVEVGRRYPANTMSMVLLAVPALGILISATFLGERIDGQLVAGVLLIGVGIRLATRSPS